MSGHTPEPWAFRTVTEYDEGDKVTAVLLETTQRPVPLNDPCILAIREDWMRHLVATPQGQANARRIVACVNACAGIPTEALEAIAPGTLATWRTAALKAALGIPARNRYLDAAEVLLAALEEMRGERLPIPLLLLEAEAEALKLLETGEKTDGP